MTSNPVETIREQYLNQAMSFYLLGYANHYTCLDNLKPYGIYETLSWSERIE